MCHPNIVSGYAYSLYLFAKQIQNIMREIAFILFAFLLVVRLAFCQEEEVVLTSINGFLSTNLEYTKGLKRIIHQVFMLYTKTFSPLCYQLTLFPTRGMFSLIQVTVTLHIPLLKKTRFFQRYVILFSLFTTFSSQFTNTFFIITQRT